MPSPHLLTVVLEDYYQARAFRSLVEPAHWYRFEGRLDQTTDRLLTLLDSHDSHATFFVFGWVAEHVPGLVRRIADAGHEVGDRGYLPLDVRSTSAAEFVGNVRRGRRAVEAATGRPVRGHRHADGLRLEATAQLDQLAVEGYDFDSSLRMDGLATAARRQRARPFVHTAGTARLLELPVSMQRWGPYLVAPTIGSAFQHRQLRASAPPRIGGATDAPDPMVSCLHTWQLDPGQPRLAVSRPTRFRHDRQLHLAADRLERLLRCAPSRTIAEWMSLPSIAEPAGSGHVAVADLPSRERAHLIVDASGSPGEMHAPSPKRLSVVIPCFNESAGLGYLERTLSHVAEAMSPEHTLEYVFVDDGSSDDTWSQLQARFGHRADCVLVRHPTNRGVAGAIRSGVMAAREAVVASIDADCTYDPHALPEMIALLDEGVALVTASPYHPRGGVRNVAAWRLMLSRGLSMIYRRLLTNRLHTITSCCRIYRRDVVLSVPMAFDDYRGIAEWLIRIDLAGGRIVEYPAILHARVLGTSKMKVARSIFGHLQLMLRMVRLRFGRPDRLTSLAVPADSTSPHWVATDSAPA